MRIENKVHVEGSRVHYYDVPLNYTGAQYSAVVKPRTRLWYAVRKRKVCVLAPQDDSAIFCTIMALHFHLFS